MSSQHDTIPHPTADDVPEMPGEFEILETAVRELAVEHGLFSAADHRQWLEWMDAANPGLGAQLVARAWVDPAYRERALANGTAAAQEIGITMYARDASMRYLVMPMRPAGTEGWSPEQLAAIVTRDCMIGVALPSAEGPLR
jgi:Nitrile hydratase, alpha chain